MAWPQDKGDAKKSDAAVRLKGARRRCALCQPVWGQRMAVMILGISSLALFVGLIVLGITAAHFSLGLIAGRHLAVIGMVPGSSWVWGLVRWYVDTDAGGVVGVLTMIGVCGLVMLLAFACARHRLLRKRALQGIGS